MPNRKKKKWPYVKECCESTDLGVSAWKCLVESGQDELVRELKQGASHGGGLETPLACLLDLVRTESFAGIGDF
jgi:hypothetical protein